LAAEAAVVFAPSRHYALDLERHGVSEKVEVVHNGVDDDIVKRILESDENSASKNSKDGASSSNKRANEKSVRLVWSGRMQWEKRPLEFLQAVADSGIEAQVELYGRGILMRKAQRLARELKLTNVHFKGSVPYSRMLRAFADADALVQTSVGFETQGMTVYEAAAVGTPSILCDHNIAKEFGAGTMWVVADDSVASLAKSLRRAVDDILAGDERYKKLARENHILQSGATNRMLRFYKSVVSKSQAPKY
jgi:glycosyltransferase involved in cell wall biosynthesis